MCFAINTKSFDYGKSINWKENGCSNVNYGKLFCAFQEYVLVVTVTAASGCSAPSVCSFPSQEELEKGASGSIF